MSDKTNKPCDGFDLAKTSKVKALGVILPPILALGGWLILLLLISRR